MQEQEYDELSERATAALEKGASNLTEALEAQHQIAIELAGMRAEDKILELSDEEERMLRCFRAFKSRCIPCDVFKWVTNPEQGIATPPERVLVEDPQDVSKVRT